MLLKLISRICRLWHGRDFIIKVWLDSLGIPGVGTLLMFAPFGILFTIFAAVGVVNVLILLTASTAYHPTSRYPSPSHCQSCLQAENTKFQFFGFTCRRCVGVYGPKFPNGKIFLGDGGAYTVTYSFGLRLFSSTLQLTSVPLPYCWCFFGQWRTLPPIWRR